MFGSMATSFLTLSLKKFGKQFIIIVEKIAVFDEFLKLRGKKFSENANFIFIEIIIFVSAISILIILDAVSNFKDNSFPIVTLLFLYTCYIIQLVMVTQFINFTLLINLFLKELKKFETKNKFLGIFSLVPTLSYTIHNAGKK